MVVVGPQLSDFEGCSLCHKAYVYGSKTSQRIGQEINRTKKGITITRPVLQKRTSGNKTKLDPFESEKRLISTAFI